MSNKFKEYGFKRKMFQGLDCTGVKGEALKDTTYGYSREFKIDDNDNLTSITLNIIPNGTEWICEREDYNGKIFREIMNHEIVDRDGFLNSSKSKIKYAMQELGYTEKSYSKVSRWAYMESKEEALKEIVEQYSYLFE
jgi:hypothetical protein